MSMFINSWCAKSLGFKFNGRKIKSASVTNRAANVGLCVWKACYNVAERVHLQAFSLGVLGQPWPLASCQIGSGFPFLSLIFFLSVLVTVCRWHGVGHGINSSAWNPVFMVASAYWLQPRTGSTCPVRGDLCFSSLGWLDLNWRLSSQPVLSTRSFLWRRSLGPIHPGITTCA